MGGWEEAALAARAQLEEAVHALGGDSALHWSGRAARRFGDRRTEAERLVAEARRCADELVAAARELDLVMSTPADPASGWGG